MINMSDINQMNFENIRGVETRIWNTINIALVVSSILASAYTSGNDEILRRWICGAGFSFTLIIGIVGYKFRLHFDNMITEFLKVEGNEKSSYKGQRERDKDILKMLFILWVGVMVFWVLLLHLTF